MIGNAPTCAAPRPRPRPRPSPLSQRSSPWSTLCSECPPPCTDEETDVYRGEVMDEDGPASGDRAQQWPQWVWCQTRWALPCTMSIKPNSIVWIPEQQCRSNSLIRHAPPPPAKKWKLRQVLWTVVPRGCTTGCGTGEWTALVPELTASGRPPLSPQLGEHLGAQRRGQGDAVDAHSWDSLPRPSWNGDEWFCQKRK